MCSWNLSALGLVLIAETGPVTESLAGYLREAAQEIAVRLTEDPAEAVEDPIKLPDGVTQEMASARLDEMADVVEEAVHAHSPGGARAHLERLFGAEIKAIRERENTGLQRASRAADGAAVAGALSLPESHKPTRSHGA
jgi:hypothetical protein